MSDTAATLSRRVARHVAGTAFADLPAPAVRAAKRSLIDGLGVMFAASGLGEGTAAFADMAQAAGGPGESSLIGRPGKVALLMGALANGALAHAIDFEDSFDNAPVHPNAVQLPAVLALAEQKGDVSGRALLEALAIGCDLVCRLGLALDVIPDRYGWYPPPILGAFGAVAACGKLLHLDERQLLDAFSLLLCSHTCSAELKYSPDSDVRAIRDAFPAQAAVQAVLLAARGVRGFDAPFEGPAGLFSLYARGAYTPERITDGLGTKFHGEDVSFKPWPSCRGTHPFIEASLELAAAHGIEPHMISSIRLTGNPVLKMLVEPREQKLRPRTAVDAKFSLPFTVGTALRHRRVDLESFSVEGRADEAVLAIGRKLSFEPSDAEDYRGLSSGRIVIELEDGRTFDAYVRHPSGHPANPLSDDALEAKFRMCLAYAEVPPSAAAVDHLLATLWRIEDIAEVGASLLQPDLALPMVEDAG